LAKARTDGTQGGATVSDMSPTHGMAPHAAMTPTAIGAKRYAGRGTGSAENASAEFVEEQLRIVSTGFVEFQQRANVLPVALSVKLPAFGEPLLRARQVRD
jgi:hypothetical protein